MYATFALRWNFGDPEVMEYWILDDDERWHDIVRGDGGTYSPSGISEMEALPRETRAAFRDRVKARVKQWEAENPA